MVTVRYQEWMRRYAAARLDSGAEVWADLSTHPTAARLEARAQASGRTVDADEISYVIARPLMLSVIHAAGGVEYTVQKLIAALDLVQQQADEYYSATPQARGKGLWALAHWDVSFEVSNLVVWARTLLERLDSRKWENGREVKVGLLVALAEGERKQQVQRFRDRLYGWVKAERYLANYTLHIGPLHSGTPFLRVENDGRARFLLPDRPEKGPIWSLEEFTYRQARDVRTVASDLLGQVERFMDGLLTSLEQHVPERFRR
jgi:hypothetical protein